MYTGRMGCGVYVTSSIAVALDHATVNNTGKRYVFVVDALLGRSHEAIHARFQAALLTGSEKLMISAAQTQTNLDNLQTICRDLQTLSVRTNITSVR